ncbi:MAG: PepSY domain-containing protein [Sphingomonadaceae bacterium]|nr:PepSY domain-containing protein [Sphingomonadaceae bacterium]
MKSILKAAAVLSLTIGGTAIAASAATHGYVGQRLASKAKVTMTRASAIALKAHPGRITDKELENEGGGSGLRYSFDIVSGGKTFEVGVDARTGAVLENKAEGKNPD